MEGITKEQEERLLLYATYTILYINDTACFSIQQLNKEVMDKDKESKKIYGALLKRSRLYLNKIEEVVDRTLDVWCDYCTEMDEICDEAYQEFKNSLLNAYKEHNIEDYQYMASIEIMRSAVELSVESGRRIIEDVTKYIPKAKWFERYLLVDMLRVANNFSNWAYRKIPKGVHIDFNEQSEVMIKFRKLSSLLIDYYSFDKAYRKTIEMGIERKNKNNNE